ncbi:beta-agarase [Verrucomicrobia bacterium S94]|nr:beta-agarase [Verrucomicrobia bacterium S94]
MKIISEKNVVLSVLFMGLMSHARTTVDIQLNMKYSVGGISSFDRHKYINAHSHLSEPDWVGEDELLDILVSDLNVSFGRDNGTMIEYLRQAPEDPDRPGYVDPEYLKNAGRIHRKIIYGSHKAYLHKYDAVNDVMIGGQPHAFLPSPGEEKTDWELGGADAVGEYMGRFLQEFYRNPGEPPTAGQSRPRFIEILNEPLYHFIDGRRGDTRSAKSIFEFHNGAVKAIRRFDSEVLIGGPTMAFPIFEERDFARWNERMKLFIDTCGEQMDFYSLHFYDFNNRGDRGRDDYKGSRLEATLDMIEQYSLIRLGEVKPFIISEYGGRDHKLENRAWTALRDWHFLKAATPLTLQFLDRPNLILKSIPFITAKAEWGRKNGVPYNRRLMHQRKERPGRFGEDWIFTDLVLFYELWSDVNGTRVKTASDNPDVLLDSYVDGKKAYVILSNLNPVEETVDLNLSCNMTSARIKHLYRVADGPVLEEKTVKKELKSFTLKPEASAVIECRFAESIAITETVEEYKFYASDYNRPITGGRPVQFALNEVQPLSSGEAVLRVGFGREPDRSRWPEVVFNGTALEVPDNYSGSDQPTRPAFFGLLEIPVPVELIKKNNSVEIMFPDSGGRISSVTLKTVMPD